MAKILDSNDAAVKECIANLTKGSASGLTAQKGLKSLTPRTLYRANPIDRIELARAGIKASKIGVAARLLRIPKDRLVQLLGFSKATITRKVGEGSPLNQEQSARLMGILALVGQIEEAHADSGNPEADDFDAGAWVSIWLERPLPALGHRRPGEFMDSFEGQMLISRVLAQSLAGAYV